MYSTIKKKSCKQEGCTKYPAMSLSGFCYEHADEELIQKLGTRRAQSKKKKAKLSTLKRKLYAVQHQVECRDLREWYEARRKEMTGVCSEEGCSADTNKDNEYYYWSVAHIVPKSLIKSAAINHQNFLELCQSHHYIFDSSFEAASKLKCFMEAKRKFNLFKGLIPPEELRKVNQFLL